MLARERRPGPAPHRAHRAELQGLPDVVREEEQRPEELGGELPCADGTRGELYLQLLQERPRSDVGTLHVEAVQLFEMRGCPQRVLRKHGAVGQQTSVAPRTGGLEDGLRA